MKNSKISRLCARNISEYKASKSRARDVDFEILVLLADMRRETQSNLFASTGLAFPERTHLSI